MAASLRNKTDKNVDTSDAGMETIVKTKMRLNIADWTGLDCRHFGFLSSTTSI